MASCGGSVKIGELVLEWMRGTLYLYSDFKMRLDEIRADLMDEFKNTIMKG